jgi:hypothetical protein
MLCTEDHNPGLERYGEVGDKLIAMYLFTAKSREICAILVAGQIYIRRARSATLSTMTDDAEVSEEVIRQMGNEIIRLREQLAALRNPSGRADDTDQVKYLSLL